MKRREVSHPSLGVGKWVFVDWLGIEPGYGTQWGGSLSEGWCVPEGIELKVHRPAVNPIRVIIPDRPWEDNRISPYATFLEDDGILRCWYENGGGLGYAESADGVNWKKPSLGLCEWKGSRDNNLVPVVGLEVDPEKASGFPHGCGIFKDSSSPESERYKMVSCRWTDTERQVSGAVSADGLNWTALPKPLMEHQHADTQNISLYDAALDKYVLFTRQAGGLTQRRGVNRAESTDFRHLASSRPVLENSPLDPPDWDIYCNGYSRWPGATDAHLMRLSVYERTPDTMKVHLATSRNGTTWHRPLGREPWVGSVTGPERNYPTVYACSGIVATESGEWSTYLGVTEKLHNQPKEDRETARSGIVRAVLREDGFVSISSRGRGTFWTIPFQLNSDTIRVNVRTLYSGFLRCQILSSSPGDVGSATRFIEDLEDYTLEASQEISGDHIDAPLSWNGAGSVGSLRGQTIRLRFDLYKADLFAIRF